MKAFAASIFVVVVDWLFERRGGQGREFVFIFLIDMPPRGVFGIASCRVSRSLSLVRGRGRRAPSRRPLKNIYGGRANY